MSEKGGKGFSLPTGKAVKSSLKSTPSTKDGLLFLRSLLFLTCNATLAFFFLFFFLFLFKTLDNSVSVASLKGKDDSSTKSKKGRKVQFDSEG